MGGDLDTSLTEHAKRYPSAAGFVFTSAEGSPVRHRNFTRRHFRPAVLKARAKAVSEDREGDAIPEDLRFHDLRQTCAAILIGNDRHIEEVKDHLGHSSIRTTSDRYGHLFPTARRALADGLDETFQRTRKPRPKRPRAVAARKPADRAKDNPRTDAQRATKQEAG